MAMIKDPVALAKETAAAYQKCYGSLLQSVTVYGSAAGAGYDPKRSDINLLVVVSEMTLAVIEQSAYVQEQWGKRRFALPLIMDPSYIAASLDSFPLEFFTMKNRHNTVYGPDPFAGVQIKTEDLRLQVERELKGKWLHLMQEWPGAKRNRANLLRLAGISLKEFAFIFQGLLFLKNKPVPDVRSELFSSVISVVGLADNPFAEVASAVGRNDHAKICSLFPGYSQTIFRIINAIDKQ